MTSLKPCICGAKIAVVCVYVCVRSVNFPAGAQSKEQMCLAEVSYVKQTRAFTETETRFLGGLIGPFLPLAGKGRRQDSYLKPNSVIHWKG